MLTLEKYIFSSDFQILIFTIKFHLTNLFIFISMWQICLFIFSFDEFIFDTYIMSCNTEVMQTSKAKFPVLNDSKFVSNS